METKNKLLLSGATLMALVSVNWSPAFGQGTPRTTTPAAAPAATQPANAEADETVKLGEYVVTGVRASLESAAEIKRDDLGIVDSIVASDINKLPDYNVTDALQRITGVQIQRDRGEGIRINIRGLEQMEHTLNGREIFTAGLSWTGSASRQVDFADIPAEMVARLNVYKSSAADQLEGGIGGLVEMVTRRPFDFKGFEATGSARLVWGDLIEKTKPQYSVLATNRWKLSNGGEIGALINFTYQERAWREDQKGTGTPSARTDIIPGQTVNVQNSTSESTVFGSRKRTGISSVLQWRPSDTLELYAEWNYTKFNTFQDTNQINATGAAFTFTGTPVLAPGTNDLQKITWTNPTISVLSFARDTHDWTKQYAGGAIWRSGDFTLKFDASYTDSYNDLFFSGPFFGATASQFTQDLSPQVPNTGIVGTDLTDPSIYRYTGIAYRYRPYKGDLTAFALDGTYTMRNNFLDSVLVGLRHAKRFATNKPGLIFADFNYAANAGPLATAFPDLVTTNNEFGFMPHTDVQSIKNYMTGVLAPARDVVPYRALFGITTPLPEEASPLTLWNIDETTDAAYAMAKFKGGDAPIDGNIGVRFIHTKEAVVGSQGTSATNAVPVNIHSTYNSVLPSLNSRYKIQPDLFLRFSASKTLTRPDFQQLSPSLTLVPNPVNPANNQGSAGNPGLSPIKSDNLDLALEKYFTPSTYVYATVFHKKVKGFIVSSGATEVIDGVTYLITRPQNANPATIEGFELGYTQFFDFVPDPFKGFGVQANYTYVDSETPNATLASNTPLPNLSRNSYNVIAMYETKKVSARLAYNWRDKFLSGQANIANVGRVPFYTKAYGWMDGSFAYHFSDNITVTLEGTNLLRTKRISYYGRTTLPQNVFINDRQFSVSGTYRF